GAEKSPPSAFTSATPAGGEALGLANSHWNGWFLTTKGLSRCGMGMAADALRLSLLLRLTKLNLTKLPIWQAATEVSLGLVSLGAVKRSKTRGSGWAQVAFPGG